MLCTSGGLRAKTDQARIWDTDVLQVFQELVKSMIRVADD